MSFAFRLIISICLGIFLLNSNFCTAKSQEHLQKETEKFIPTCISPENKPVDWFVIYLFPKDKKNKLISYAYIDAHLSDFKVYSIDDTATVFPPIRITLGLNSSKANFMIWNDDPKNADEPAPKYSESYAHSKGILAYSDISSVYVIHSLPRFPLRKQMIIQRELPGNSGSYAQTFFCSTLPLDQASSVLSSLSILNINVILHGFSAEEEKEQSELYKAIEVIVGKKKGPFTKYESKTSQIKTSDGLKIDLFAKTKSDKTLPWDAPIPEKYKASFFVETWTRPELLPVICTTKNQYTLNIVEVIIKNISFKNTEDHSKWGVSEKEDVICYGDLNRTESQKHRAGTIACFRNKKVSGLVRNFITNYQQCEEIIQKSLQFLEEEKENNIKEPIDVSQKN